MDLALWDAAIVGDVKFLKEAVAVQPSEYFLTQSTLGNIFHIAARKGKVKFLKEAMNILHTDIQKQLLLQTTDGYMYNVLHVAALTTDIIFVKLIREMYASLSWDDVGHVKPWLTLTSDGKTPLNLALSQYKVDENCAMEILLMDPQFMSCTIADKYGNTPLYLAVRRGFNLVAENIFDVSPPCHFFYQPRRFLDPF